MPIHKVKEMMIDGQERIYTKEEILTWYLNIVSFGNNMFGIDVAQTPFNQELDDINIENAAVPGRHAQSNRSLQSFTQ